MSTTLQLEGFLCGALRLTPDNGGAHALNERSPGGNHPVACSEDEHTPEKDDP